MYIFKIRIEEDKSFIFIKRYPQGANVYIIIHIHTMRNLKKYSY
jgi:hypothetical protein